MLRWALAFLIVALVAALFGFTEIASGAAWIAQFLFFLFIVAFVFCAVLGVRHRRIVVLRLHDSRKASTR